MLPVSITIVEEQTSTMTIINTKKYLHIFKTKSNCNQMGSFFQQRFEGGHQFASIQNNKFKVVQAQTSFVLRRISLFPTTVGRVEVNYRSTLQQQLIKPIKKLTDLL